jgi:outer membrane protein TolC
MIRLSARVVAIVAVLYPAMAAAQGTQTAPQTPPPSDARAGASVRHRSLSDRARGARAGQCIDCRRQRRQIRVLAEARFTLAIQPRYGQQHLRPGTPTVGDPGDVWSGPRLGLRRQRLGEGALFSWEPFDFGLRHATVASAEAAVARSRAGEELTRLDVQTAVGAAILNIVGAQRAVAALQADVDRRDLLARAVRTLVDNQLRPGAEASRTDAERAAAQTRLIQAQQAVTLAQITLARVLGATTAPIAIDATTLVDRLPTDAPASGPTTHPFTQVRQAAVDVARAQEDILSRTDLPRVYFQSSVFARGSGANANGQLDGSLSGLGPDRANWAAGVQVVFPNLFDFTSLRARKAAAAASARARAAWTIAAAACCWLVTISSASS